MSAKAMAPARTRRLQGFISGQSNSLMPQCVGDRAGCIGHRVPRKALLQRLELSVKMMLAVCAIVVALTGYESRAVSAAPGIPFDAATVTEDSAVSP